MPMYTEVGVFDAKAKLSEILQQVKAGRCYTITLRGYPVADLVPSKSAAQQDVHTAIEIMRSIHKVQGISAETVAEWMVEGRE